MSMKKMIVFIFCLFVLSGCADSQDNEAVVSNMNVEEMDVEETDVEVPDAEEMDVEETDIGEKNTEESDDRDFSEVSVDEDTAVVEYDSEELLDAFLAGEIPAICDDEDESVILFDQLPHDPDDWECCSAGERIDLDNDGENEQIVTGPYGGMYLDARDGKVYVLASGQGTAGVLSYTVYDNATWIVHRDTSHMGRQIYWLTKYDGEGNIVDEFELGAEYWDSVDDKYDENSDFTYRDQKISMSEYEELKDEILGDDTDVWRAY